MEPETNTRKRALWRLAATGALLLMLSVALGACGATGSGKVAVEPQQIDYGRVKFGTDETIRIKVTNTGAGPLRFTEQPYIEVVEGC